MILFNSPLNYLFFYLISSIEAMKLLTFKFYLRNLFFFQYLIFKMSQAYYSPRPACQKKFQNNRVRKISSYNRLPFDNQSVNTSTGSDVKINPTKNNLKRLSISDFTQIRILGEGVYGKVILAIHNETGFIGAIKMIHKQKLRVQDQQQGKKLRNQLIRQIKIQSFMAHPNIVKLYSYFDDEKFIYLLMEAATDGQLYSLLKKKQKFNEKTVSFIVKQILLAINYMHQYQIIHRDLKPQNIIITYGTVKICDFGWSVHCPKEVRTTLCGTPLYLSPELLKGNQYNKQVDQWAIGVLTHQLVTGQNPFQIKTASQIVKIITDQFIMKLGSPSIKNFITSALVKDPQKRSKTKQMLDHPFIKKYQGMEIAQELINLPQNQLK